MKICRSCKQEKELPEFRKNKNRPDGHENYCKTCRKEEQKVSYRVNNWNEKRRKRIQENPEKNRAYQKFWRESNREKILEYEITYSKKNIKSYILKNAKFRAKQKGIEFSITEEDFTIPELCPIFNEKLIFERGKGYKNRRFQPSLDRIDNSKGYIKGNIWVISSLANVMKNNASLEDLKTFCENFLKHINNDFNN